MKKSENPTKSATKKAVDKLVPMVKSNEWFFDTELLILGEKLGYKIKEIPVMWEEDPDSRVVITTTVSEYIKNVLRLRIYLFEIGKL